VEHLWVLLKDDWLLALLECITGRGVVGWYGASLLFVVFASVFIDAVDADLTAIDASVGTNAEVIGREWSAILLNHTLALQESTLCDTSVDLLRLSDHNRLIFKVVEDGELSDAMVLKSGLTDMLLEVTVESQDLLVELDKGWLELLLRVTSCEVIWELVVGVG